MKKNMGKVDRTVRLVVAAILLILYATGVVSGVVGTILAVLAVVFVLTSLIGFCPLYVPIKLSTKKGD